MIGQPIARAIVPRVAALLLLLPAACTEQLPLPVDVPDGGAGGSGGTRSNVTGNRPRDAAVSFDSPMARPPQFVFDGGRGDRPGDAGPVQLSELLMCTEVNEVSFRIEGAVLIIALDRSFSMYTKFGDRSRIGAVQAALKTLIRTHQGAILIGYEEFPGVRPFCGNQTCCAGPVVVHPAPNQLQAIERAMSCDSPMAGCFETSETTPTSDALRRCRDAHEFFDGAPDRYVLLITDGDPSCPVDRTAQAMCDRTVAEISNLAVNRIKTYVVGVSDAVKTTTCLDQMALAGGVARAAAPYYLPAGDDTELRQQLQDVFNTASARACRITLRSVPPNPDKVAVLFDNRPVPRDPTRTEGWSFDPDSPIKITVYGSWCDRIRTSQVRDIDIFRCRQ